MFDMFDICHVISFVDRRYEEFFQSFLQVDQNIWSALATIYFNMGHRQLFRKEEKTLSKMSNYLREEYNTNSSLY